MNADGGIQANALRYLTGVPVFSYWSDSILNESTLTEYWSNWKEAYENNYILNIGTRNGNDQDSNECGVALGHAYSILAVFDLTDENDDVHNMLLIRNPWGESTYNIQWSQLDPVWTDELVAQVPLGMDPRTSGSSFGVFVMPKELVRTCFEEVIVAHTKGEDYSDNWYDALDIPGEVTRRYSFLTLA